MTIKEATQKMLLDIERANQEEVFKQGKRGYDKQIAKKLELTQASYSRLRNGITMPKVTTWYKIIKLHENLCGLEKNINIITKIT